MVPRIPVSRKMKNAGMPSKVAPSDMMEAKAFYTISKPELQHLISTGYDFRYIPRTHAGLTALMATITNRSNNEDLALLLVDSIPNAAKTLDFTATNVDNNNALILAIIMGFEQVAIRLLELSDSDERYVQIEQENDDGQTARSLAVEQGLNGLLSVMEKPTLRGGKTRQKSSRRKTCSQKVSYSRTKTRRIMQRK